MYTPDPENYDDHIWDGHRFYFDCTPDDGVSEITGYIVRRVDRQVWPMTWKIWAFLRDAVQETLELPCYRTMNATAAEREATDRVGHAWEFASMQMGGKVNLDFLPDGRLSALMDQYFPPRWSNGLGKWVRG